MTFKERARNFWGCVSICFNQAIHWGGAPYPLTLSETCYIRQCDKRYRFGVVVIDGLFSLFGEHDHCRKSWIKGAQARRYYA